ncbi:ABC transporter permease [Treponema phagedenis]|uniref:ABC transporter permease n=1 Tax=Treponema phagedenis TaxID=162 RepID=A0AAE6M8B2_TREPH|nr:ABC transporter permease [Treponema phagedenis]NVP23597.1 ABC transporter permease [Treponema phagedenis]QEJ98730.1 ABC transporter permease [Treponema phagedenis]QEK04235.1 ABC transporter permease [Treponema phagedenis]QEK09850.1 ABC transporter permease [Treponema phagedenis]QLC58428.1 ABC transporter permease [Treponema phagedenis]
MSFASFIESSLIFIAPLLIVALAGMFSEKSGTVNIALEGIMIIGAFCGILFVDAVKNNEFFQNNVQFMLIIALILGSLGSLLYSILLGFLAINMKADQTIGGTALNILAPALSVFLIKAIISQDTSQIIFHTNFQLGAKTHTDFGRILFGTGYLTTILAVVIWAVSIFVIYKTKFGLRLSACGENPSAAQSLGINVFRYRWLGVLISGALGGFGGVTYIITTTTRFGGSVGGYGFLALAVLIFGQWKPVRVMFAAVFFGLFQALSATAFQIPYLKELGALFYLMLPYVATLLVLIVNSKKSRAPKASGVPFEYKYK